MLVADPLAAHPAKLAGIRALTVEVEEVRAKFKYGGNVDREHRRAVVEQLRTRNGPGDAAAAEHTLRRLGPPGHQPAEHQARETAGQGGQAT